jgi:hypothetical protein
MGSPGFVFPIPRPGRIHGHDLLNSILDPRAQGLLGRRRSYLRLPGCAPNGWNRDSCASTCPRTSGGLPMTDPTTAQPPLPWLTAPSDQHHNNPQQGVRAAVDLGDRPEPRRPPTAVAAAPFAKRCAPLRPVGRKMAARSRCRQQNSRASSPRARSSLQALRNTTRSFGHWKPNDTYPPWSESSGFEGVAAVGGQEQWAHAADRRC